MPHYYFDTKNGTGLIRDEVGYDLPDHAAARAHGLDCLPDMAGDEIPDGDLHAFTVIVRNGDRQVIYVATLNLVGTWLM